MKYNQLIVYYFSGTGNAKNAAHWITKIAKEKNLKTHLISIDRFRKVELPEMTEKTLVGFCAPTHGFNMPPLALKFLVQFPKSRNADVFILNTRGGLKLNRIFLPGLSGIAQILPAIILWVKGYKIVGMQPLDLPSNWLILHPGLKNKVIESIYSRCYEIVKKFTIRLLDGNRTYKACISLPVDIALIPVAIAYYLIGRFFLAKTLIATDSCTRCDVCIVKCPVEAIKKVNKRPFWTYKCESCMRCVNICPERAIETTHTYTALLVVISSLILSPLTIKGLKYIGLLDFIYRSELTKKLITLFNSIIFILFVFICYQLLHYLLQFKFISRLVAYTSLSRYRFWRRYKSPGKHIK